jgi:hypothetical protein
MTRKASDPRTTKNSAPFGAQTPRSRGPLLLWVVLYAGWFLLLVWMAAFRTGR